MAAKEIMSKGTDLVGGLEGDFASKLKQLLSMSIKKAIEVCGKDGGYLRNDQIRIRFPSSLAPVEKAIRKLGKGDKVDNFEDNMNTAAEAAVPKLTQIFLKAIEALSFVDAQAIFQGTDPNAGTKYLQTSCSAELNTAVTPHIQDAMVGTGAHNSWEKARKVVSKTPAKSKAEGFDMIKYVVQGTLDGLFKMCAQFELENRKFLP